jgi:hypothetical protein
MRAAGRGKVCAYRPLNSDSALLTASDSIGDGESPQKAHGKHGAALWVISA